MCVFSVYEIDFFPIINEDAVELFSVCTSKGRLGIYSTENPKKPVIDCEELHSIRCVRFHPSGEYLITGGDDPQV